MFWGYDKRELQFLYAAICIMGSSKKLPLFAIAKLAKLYYFKHVQILPVQYILRIKKSGWIRKFPTNHRKTLTKNALKKIKEIVWWGITAVLIVKSLDKKQLN